MLEVFKECEFRQATLDMIEKVREILDEYQGQGLRLTLRQLYYQLVALHGLPNEEKSYKNLGDVVSKARLAGLLDWDAIEDRVRVPRVPSEWNSVADLVESALYAYRLPRWKDQRNYVELWVEKDALAGVLAPIASEYHVPLMVNRGYSSQSAMYESAKRFKRRGAGKSLTLLYLGDHDPSGEDMVRDVGDRLEMFGVERLKVEKLALTMAQIQKYNPPPNPAKMTDSRAPGYVAKFGTSSWEVDALPPNVLAQIIGKALERLVNRPAMERVKTREQEDKAALRKAARTLSDQKSSASEEGPVRDPEERLHLRRWVRPDTLCGERATIETCTDDGAIFADISKGDEPIGWLGPLECCSACLEIFNEEA